jgi:hypothetical protein
VFSIALMPLSGLPLRHTQKVRAFPPDDLKRSRVATEEAEAVFNVIW